MLRQLHAILAPIRTRQRIDRGLRWMVAGALVGGVAGSALLVVRWLGTDVESTVALAVLAYSALAGFVAGLLWPASWHASARLADAAFDLKDRTLTALDFAGRTELEPVHRLQVEDALGHLAKVDSKRAAPWRLPRLTPVAGVAIAVMLILLITAYPPGVSQASLPSGPLDVVLEQADLLEETLLEELEELAQETEDPELEQLAEEMKQAIDELRDPEVDQYEALAQLSEMQAVLATAMEQLDTQRVDAELQQLAEALQDASATQAASEALKESDYEKAAKELEKIEASTMTRKERDAVAANLKKLSDKLGEGKKGKLSDSVKEMAEGLEKEDPSKCKSGFCKAAGECRKQGTKKKISECLACQLNRLSECKGCCQGEGQCNNPGSNVAKSDSPSNKAGMGASNKPLGEDKTKLNSKRRNEDLSGIAGDGPSERETLASAEAEQDAARSYKERYAEYRKQMEEVLDSEPLPLGHRETVRKYFESIRPTGEEDAAVNEQGSE